MLTLAEVAKACRVTPETVMSWVRKGAFPPPAKLGARAQRWDPEIVRRHLRSAGEAEHVART
jgi:predicted DNA-binding transcriptional regulator AlpA